MKVLIFATHPIQYHVPVYRKLAEKVDLKVIYLHKQTKEGQAEAGFNVAFEWDVPMFEGYEYEYMKNHSPQPATQKWNGIILDKRELQEIFEKHQPQKVIIYGWFPKGIRQVLNYCYKQGIPVLSRGDSNLFMSTSLIKKIVKEVYIRNILRKIDTFLVVGEGNRNFYRHYGVKEERLVDALHCIDTPFFTEQFEKVERSKGDKVRVGFAGKLIRKKNPMLLLEAVNASQYRSEIEIVVVGDGPLRGDMEAYAEKYGIAVQFKGFLNQSRIVPDGYAHMDVLILPSREYETWGLVVNEAMTGGIPVVVSDMVGCYPDLVDEGHTGYIFKNQSMDDLKNKLDQFTEKYKQGYAFSDAVAEKIEAYSLSNTVKGYFEALGK